MAKFKVEVSMVVYRTIEVEADSIDDVGPWSIDGLLEGIDTDVWEVCNEPDEFDVSEA